MTYIACNLIPSVIGYGTPVLKLRTSETTGINLLVQAVVKDRAYCFSGQNGVQADYLLSELVLDMDAPTGLMLAMKWLKDNLFMQPFHNVEGQISARAFQEMVALHIVWATGAPGSDGQPIAGCLKPWDPVTVGGEIFRWLVSNGQSNAYCRVGADGWGFHVLSHYKPIHKIGIETGELGMKLAEEAATSAGYYCANP